VSRTLEQKARRHLTGTPTAHLTTIGAVVQVLSSAEPLGRTVAVPVGRWLLAVRHWLAPEWTDARIPARALFSAAVLAAAENYQISALLSLHDSPARLVVPWPALDWRETRARAEVADPGDQVTVLFGGRGIVRPAAARLSFTRTHFGLPVAEPWQVQWPPEQRPTVLDPQEQQ